MEKVKKEYILYHESFLQSFLSDAVTFGFLMFLIWFSGDSKVWTYISICAFIFYLVMAVSTKSNKTHKFKSAKELKAYVDNEMESMANDK